MHDCDQHAEIKKETLGVNMHKDFLDIIDYTPEELLAMLD